MQEHLQLYVKLLEQHQLCIHKNCMVLQLNPFKPKYIPVKCDANGLIPDLLRKSLETNWKLEDAQSLTSDIPKVCYTIKILRILIRGWIFLKVLYVNPAGANPTGVSIPLERRQEIYQIAKDFDLIIFEDDPYYFLQFDEVIPPPPSKQVTPYIRIRIQGVLSGRGTTPSPRTRTWTTTGTRPTWPGTS